MTKPKYQKAEDLDYTPSLPQMQTARITFEVCPMDNCDGFLTTPFVINTDKQKAIWCTKCAWWTLA